MLKKLILSLCFCWLCITECSLMALWPFSKPKTEPEIITATLTEKENLVEKLIDAAYRGNKEAVEKILSTGLDNKYHKAGLILPPY